MLSALFSISFMTASDGFRCPDTHRLVSVGDSAHVVRRKCREPDDRNVHTETRTRRVFIEVRRGIAIYREDTYTVEVETWLYDFGDHRFMQKLHFENSALVDVHHLSWGTKGKE